MPDEHTSPARNYVVLELQEFDDTDEPYFIQHTTVESRNATNALRKAFRELRAAGFEGDTATLVVIPETMWRPTPVRAAVREHVSVAVG